MTFPIRSAADKICGLFVFARILDKIRLEARGELPAGYHVGVIDGKRTFDDRLCRFLHVGFDDLKSRVLAGGTGEEIFDWCLQQGFQPDAEQIEIWNGFMQKRGWNDAASAGLEAQKIAAGLGDRTDIQTFFALFDAEEGRPS
jgi:gluconokinase